MPAPQRCDAGPPQAEQKAGTPGRNGGGNWSSRPRAWTSERDHDMVPSSRLPEIAPLDNDRRCFPPNRNAPQCRTLIKDGTSGHGQPHVLPRERGNTAPRGVPEPPRGLRTYGAAPGRAGHAIVLVRPSGYAARSTQWRCRATLAVDRSSASYPVRKEAAGAPSAWPQPFNYPSRDHADGATLGRRRRTRRPVLKDAR